MREELSRAQGKKLHFRSKFELTSRPQPRALSLSSSDIARATPLTQPSRDHQPAQRPPSLTDIESAIPPPLPPRRYLHTQCLPSTNSGEGVISLNWTQGRKAPCVLRKCTDAVVDGSVTYFNPGGTKKIYAYNSNTDTWSQLPDCYRHYTTLAIVNGRLTTIGGSNSDELFSLDLTGRSWTRILPPMYTKRHWAVAVTTGRALIVAGGDGLMVLRTVEIMNTDTRRWSTAADLPQAMYLASATVCGDHIYMSTSKSVITCSLPALLQSCRPKIFEAQPSTPSPQGPVWSTVSNLPVEKSTLVSINNRLLTIGGCDSDDKPTTEVRLYDPVNNSWQAISHLSTPRRRCFAVVLTNNKIMVAGGYTTEPFFSETDKVEIGSMVQA